MISFFEIGCFHCVEKYLVYLLSFYFSSNNPLRNLYCTINRAWANGLNVLLDIHTMKDSQNGFDNSGQALGFQWTTAFSFIQQQSFEHWPIREARWMGTFDQETATYSSINHENIQHSLDVIERIVDRYKSHPAVQGLQVRTIECMQKFLFLDRL